MRRSDKIGNKLIGIKHLPIKKNTLLGNTVLFFESIKNPVKLFISFKSVFKLFSFYNIKPFKNLGICCNEFTHGNKSPHNLNVYLKGSLTGENCRNTSNTLLSKHKR